MKKKIGAFGAGQFSLGTLVEGRPGTTIFQNPGGGGGGGLGEVAYKDPARPPPRGTRFPTSTHVLRLLRVHPRAGAGTASHSARPITVTSGGCAPTDVGNATRGRGADRHVLAIGGAQHSRHFCGGGVREGGAGQRREFKRGVPPAVPCPGIAAFQPQTTRKNGI